MKYFKYDRYKETSYTHIGVIPSHWNLKRTKFLFDRQSRPLRECDETVTAFRDGQVTLRTNRRTEGFTQSLKDIGYQGVRCGDLVVHAMDGFAGAIGVSDSEGKCSPVYSICKPIEGLAISSYYGLYLRNLALNGYVESLAKGIRERSTEFRYAELKEVWLPVPPFGEQQTIANFLDHETAKIDTLIAKQQQLIKLLLEKRQAVISHAVTKGLNPDAPMKDSGVEWLGEVPAHWEVLQLRRLIIKIEQGKSPECENRLANDNEWAVLKTGCVNGGVFRENEHKVLPENISPHVVCEVKSGDLLMSRASGSTDLIGSVALVVNPREKLLLSDKVFRVITNRKSIKKYFWVVMNSSVARTQIEQAINGAEGLANNITKQSIMAFRLALPPISEQKLIIESILSKIENFERLIQKAQYMIEVIQERRTALISAAVTGKIDVRNWRAPQAETSMENDE